ncbi:hypothetical protein BH09BAC5_BH09BAC5_01290 [soil metagenome]
MLRKLFLFLITLQLISKSFAQNPVSFPISIGQGIPNNTIYSILQTDDQFIWAGSEAGLLRYDGLHWDVFVAHGQKSLGVTGVCKGSGSKIYCFNFNGQVMVYDAGIISVLPINETLIRNITTDSKGNLWVAGESGVQKWNETRKQFELVSSLNSRFGTGSIPGANNITADDKDRIWCTTKDKVFCLDQGNVKEYTAKLSPGDYSLLHMYQLKVVGDEAWLFSLMNTAIFHLENGVFVRYVNPSLSALLNGRKITNVEWMQDEFWIGTYSGMIRWNENSNKATLWYDQLAITDALIDIEGNYWISSLYNGLLRIPDISFLRWDPAGNKNGYTHTIKTAKLGDVSYFTTESGKIFRCSVQNGMTEIIRNENSDIQFLIPNADKSEVLFGSGGVLYIIDSLMIRRTNIENPSMRDAIQIDNGYYSCGYAGVLYCANSSNGYNESTPVISRSNDLYFDSKQKLLWVATQTGISLLDIHKTITGELQAHFMDSLSFVRVIRGSDSSVFALTQSGMVYSISVHGAITQIINVSANARISDIAVQNGTLYCASNRGLKCYDLISGSYFIADEIFGTGTDDIRDIETDNVSINLATGRGLVILPIQFNRERGKPLFNITSMEINGARDKYIMNHTYVLPYNATLLLNIGVVGYSSSGDYSVEYFLTNDSVWSSATAINGTLFFPALPSGTTSLKLRLKDHFGIYAPQQFFIQLEVQPPFWNTWYFFTLCIVCGAAVASALFAYRIGTLRKRQLNQLRRMKLESDLKLSRQTALSAQMNPHFVFNVLNSIKGYIYENDTTKAAQYLDSFASLVRRVLDLSSRPWVRLEDELEILNSYIELESMLLDGDFSYEIRTEGNLDVHWIKIPALIIQPFVENAFKHGLRHTKNAKQLIISFATDPTGEFLVVEIYDNGIGVEESQKNNLLTQKVHRSFSSAASAKRIELLNCENTGNVGVEYVSVPDKQGTRVRLKIRINDQKSE